VSVRASEGGAYDELLDLGQKYGGDLLLTSEDWPEAAQGRRSRSGRRNPSEGDYMYSP